jgi:hypothetical protein
MARTFKPGQCHFRNAEGQPACKKPIGRPHTQLCTTHQAAWAKAQREKSGKTSNVSKAKTPVSKPSAPSARSSARSTRSARPPRGRVIPLRADEAPLDIAAFVAPDSD